MITPREVPTAVNLCMTAVVGRPEALRHFSSSFVSASRCWTRTYEGWVLFAAVRFDLRGAMVLRLPDCASRFSMSSASFNGSFSSSREGRAAAAATVAGFEAANSEAERAEDAAVVDEEDVDNGEATGRADADEASADDDEAGADDREDDGAAVAVEAEGRAACFFSIS